MISGRPPDAQNSCVSSAHDAHKTCGSFGYVAYATRQKFSHSDHPRVTPHTTAHTRAIARAPRPCSSRRRPRATSRTPPHAARSRDDERVLKSPEPTRRSRERALSEGREAHGRVSGDTSRVQLPRRGERAASAAGQRAGVAGASAHPWATLSSTSSPSESHPRHAAATERAPESRHTVRGRPERRTRAGARRRGRPRCRKPCGPCALRAGPFLSGGLSTRGAAGTRPGMQGGRGDVRVAHWK